MPAAERQRLLGMSEGEAHDDYERCRRRVEESAAGR
jgi:hypothetical protein